MILDPHTWRPAGWASGQALLDAVVARAAEARAKKKRGEPLNAADFAALADDKLLRDCHATPRWVWRMAGQLCEVEPGAWEGDPFNNPWAMGANEFLAPDAWRFDGSASHLDGFWCDPGTPDDPAWPGDGPLLVNGPHSCNGRWLSLAARAGRRRIVVAVVPLDVVGWYVEHGMTCDFEVQLGRIDYDPPPGLTVNTGNERCSSLLIWHPPTRDSPIEPALIEVPDDRGRLRRCLLRPALRENPIVLGRPA